MWSGSRLQSQRDNGICFWNTKYRHLEEFWILTNLRVWAHHCFPVRFYLTSHQFGAGGCSSEFGFESSGSRAWVEAGHQGLSTKPSCRKVTRCWLRNQMNYIFPICIDFCLDALSWPERQGLLYPIQACGIKITTINRRQEGTPWAGQMAFELGLLWEKTNQ